MNNSVFLIDSNVLITPYLSYYPFDFAPGFWKQIEQSIKDGRIAILDIVESEILRGNDDLKKWIEHIEIKQYINHKELSIVEKYSEVLQFIQNNQCYKPDALAEWSRETCADPWLIATAAVYNYRIVTLEEPTIGLNTKNPSRNAKIPDVARNFHVPTIKLFTMIRELKIKLV